MLSSQSTQSKDPSLFALCGGHSATLCGRPPGVASDDAEADFGALFADLNPSSSPTEPATVPDLGAISLSGLGLDFQPASVAVEPLAGTADEPDGDTAGEETEKGNGLWPDPAGGRPDWTVRGRESGEAAAAAGRGVAHAFGRSPESAPPGLSGIKLPADQAAERATQTPRFDGLPAAALDRRQAPALPPGLARLQGAPTATDENSDSLAVSSASIEAPFAGPEGVFRGAALTRSDHPGEAARMALEKNGFSTDPTMATSDRAVPLDQLAAHVRLQRSPQGEEKFAGEGESAWKAPIEEIGSRKKSFLAAGDEVVATHGRAIGIDGAKAGANMPVTSFNAPPTHPNSDYAMTAVSSTTAAVAGAEPVHETSDSFSSAHEAVEVVLHAVEHVASRAQKSVQLSFSVAGEELAVRVEMRADEVRTTFRTDSAELRAALAQEWLQVSTGTTQTERPVRIAPAVFAAAEQSALNAFAGDTSSRGRQSGTPRGDIDPTIAGIRGRAVAAVAPPVSLPSVTSPARTSGTHRLHTLA